MNPTNQPNNLLHQNRSMAEEPIDYVSIIERKRAVPAKIRIVRTITRIFGNIAPSLTSKILLSLFQTPGRIKLNEEMKAVYSNGLVEYVEFNGQSIFTYTEGEGPKVLLVHGWGSSSYHLRHITKTLAEYGFQAITFDAPAHGQSSGKRTNGKDIALFIRHLGQLHDGFYAIVSHSFGGFATIVSLAEGLSIEKFIAISLPVNTDPLFGTFYRVFNVPPKVQKKMEQHFEKIIGRPLQSVTPIHMDLALPPTLIIHDRNDLVTRLEHVHEFMAKHPEAELFVTEGLGHRRIIKDATVHQHIVSFLKKDLKT